MSLRRTLNGRRTRACADRSRAVAVAALLFGVAARNRAGAGARAPLTINVVDVAGDLALTQAAIEAYQQKNPKLVAKVNFTKAPAPELPAKLKAMQSAGRSDIDLVLTGVVALSAGIDQGLWVKMLPDHAAKFPVGARQLSARSAQDAGAGARRGARRHVHARRARCSNTTPTRSSRRRRRRRSCSRGARRIRTGSATRGRPIRVPASRS